MDQSHIGESMWAFVVIGGFVILGIVIAVAKLMNRTTPEQLRRTEEATRELYKEQSREDASRG